MIGYVANGSWVTKTQRVVEAAVRPENAKARVIKDCTAWPAGTPGRYGVVWSRVVKIVLQLAIE